MSLQTTRPQSNRAAGGVTASGILGALAGVEIDLGSAGGTGNALTGTSTVDTGTTFVSGRLYRIRATAGNTGATTCSINGGTGVALRKSPASAALASGDIANGAELLLFYDGTYLQVLAGLTVSATDSTKLPLAGGTMTGAINVATGASHQRKINNVLVAETKELGGAAGPPCNVLYDAAGGNAMTETNSSGVIYLDLPSPDYRVRNAAASYARIGGWPLTPSDMPYSAAGATFTNDGNWYNLYSLAQGTHTGEFKIACALFSGLVTFSIAGTSISLISDGWGGSFADVTAASGKIAFRVSGGYLQINVGTGISSTPKKFLAFFFGTVN